MKSTFKVLFYVKKQSVKNGKAPVMGRITINGTQAGFMLIVKGRRECFYRGTLFIIINNKRIPEKDILLS